jgi:hypothetical protein
MANFPNEKEKTWTNPFFFVQMADTQFGMFWDVNQGTNKCEPEVALTDTAVSKINQLKPLFCVMCGDLTQVGPDGGGRFGKGNTGTKEIYDEQVQIYKTQMSKVDCFSMPSFLRVIHLLRLINLFH